MCELVTADELAARLRVRPDTVRRWARTKLIPAIRVSAKVMRFDPADVIRALRNRGKANDTGVHHE